MFVFNARALVDITVPVLSIDGIQCNELRD